MSKPGRKHVRVGHIKHGRNNQGPFHSGSGWHHRPRGQSPPGRRIVAGSRETNGTNGVYLAKVEFYDAGSGQWLEKFGGGGKSSFFPDDWTNDEVNAAIEEAKANSSPHPNNPNGKWLGQSRGIQIEGYTSGYAHGWPYKIQA
ncbi:EndoU domain-containing protein [Glycomyces sp. NPDC046736]|uniref:EndoU domain-containing protein n=1 Tax=Glycomyces sp. NPDC046736 TaxID=3155615 RepID=UPI003406A6BF